MSNSWTPSLPCDPSEELPLDRLGVCKNRPGIHVTSDHIAKCAPILAAFERWCRTLPEIPKTVEQQEEMYSNFKYLYENKVPCAYEKWFGLWWRWNILAQGFSPKLDYRLTRQFFFQGIQIAHEQDFGNC